MSPTSQRASAQALSKNDFDPEWTESHIAFLNRISVPDVSAALFCLAWLIVFNYMNGRAETVSVRWDALAADHHRSVRTTRKHLAMLQPLGLRVEPGHDEVRLSISAETMGGRS